MSSFEVKELPVCKSCLEDKMSKRPFNAKGNRAKEALELIYYDVCGSMSATTRVGFKYFIIFIDDYSRYICVYLMLLKYEAFDHSNNLKPIQRRI